MSETVIFLGAGASAALGLPTTKDLFPQILQRLHHGSLFHEEQEDRRELERCLSAILPGLNISSIAQDAKAAESLPSITDVLSQMDHLLQSFNTPKPGLRLAALARGRELLEKAIFELLGRSEPNALGMKGMPDSLQKEWSETQERAIFPSPSLEHEPEVKRTVDWLMERASRGRTTLISTNYDIEVEQELFNRIGSGRGYIRVFEEIDFGTGVREPDSGTVYPRPQNPQFGIYKLHGSINWLHCTLCDTIYLNPVGAIAYLAFLSPDNGALPQDAWRRRLQESGADQCHCGHRPLRHVIVAPSFVRDVRNPILLEIWRNALERLRRASEWFIVGYSLTPEDVAIRSLLLRAASGRDDRLPPTVKVIQKEDKDPEATRYRLLFENPEYIPGGLSNYLKTQANADRKE